ncbi:MAG: membrane integrity-associated transporter subunit PqiC [Hyphomonadaceae bacterium]|nr:membrane integrity-associated transporter subunit PqiC [Hyphomonadaceae bacterium]
MSGLKVLSAALAALLLAGCVKLLPDPAEPPRLYALEAGPVERAPGEHVAAVAGVAEPEGPQALLGDSIVWRSDGVIAFMANAAWPGRAADLLQSMLAETITRQGLLDAGVSSRGAGVRADVEVRWDLTAFDVNEADGALEARFIAQVRIISTRDRKLLKAEIVEEREAIADRSGRLAANALARAAQRGCARIALMTAEAARSAHQAAQAASAAQATVAGDQPSAASTRR